MGSHESQSRGLEQHAPATLAETLELVDQGVVVVTENGIIQDANDAFAALVGEEPANLHGTGIDTLLTPVAETATEASESRIAALLADGTDELQVVCKTDDGYERPFILTATQGDDELICVCREETTEKGDRQAQDNPQPSSTAEFTGHDQQTLDTVGDPVYVLDNSGVIQQVNDAMIAFTGYEREELVGRGIGEVMPATEYDRQTSQLLTLADEGEQTATFETKMLTNSGDVALIEVTVTVQRGPDGSYAGSMGVIRDIRGHKRRQRDLELLKQVLARTFRHNVRNELMVAKSHAEVLEEQIDSELHAHTEMILETADRLLSHSEKARFIEDVIEVDEYVEVDLDAVVEDAVDTVTAAYPNATVDIDLQGSGVIRAHPHVPSAIEELLENALEHAPPGVDPSVDIWAHKQTEAITLFVEDESGGLDDHEVEVLRAGSESDLEHTSGVGLWLIRWLVEYSDAGLVVHRTDTGTIIGIQFRPATGDATRDIEETYSPLDTPFTPAPDTIREHEPEQFRGDTVVGRVEARRQLQAIYDDLSQTGGHSVIVTGEAGIGKTTLVEQFRAELKQAGDVPVIATGFCKQDVQSPYHPFKAVIDELPVGQSFEEIRSKIDAFDESDSDEAKRRKQAMFSDIADQFRAVVTDQPAVVVIEDMHWADSGTIDLFEFLVDELGRWSHPILFLCTYRTSSIDGSHPVLNIAAEAEGMGRGTVIELEPFSSADVEILLASLLGVDELPDSVVEVVHDQTGGNPLFVSELGTHLVSELGPIKHGDQLLATLEDITVPETIEQAITQRLDALPAEVMRTLEAGAVLGESFTFDVLREASGQSIDRLIESVNTLVRREVWARSGGDLEFVHGVIRDQVRDGIEPATERTLHERAAQAIETVHADELDEYSSRLAYHYERIDAYETAFDYARQAGDVASESYANDEAIAAYERAISLATEQDAATDMDVAAVYADLAGVYNRIDNLAAADEAVEAGLTVADPESAVRCRLLSERATVLETQSAYEDATETLEQQRELAAAQELRSLEAGALDALGTVANNRGEYERAIEYHERSLAICEETGDLRQQAASLKNLGTVAVRRGAYDQAIEYYERSLPIYEEISDRQGQANSLNNLGIVAYRRGAYNQAIEYYERSLAIYEDIGDRRGQARSLNNLGIVATERGAYDQAFEYYDRTLEIKDDIGDRQGRAQSLNNLGIVAYRRGAYDQAIEYFERSLEIREEIGDRRGQAESLNALAVIARKQQNDDAARSFLDRAGDILADTEAVREQILYHHERAAHARNRANYEQATSHVEKALAACETTDIPKKELRVHLERVRLALARGKPAQAREYVEAAHSVLADLDTPLEAGRASHLEGRTAAAAGETEAARERFREALAAFEDIGVTPDTLRTLEHLTELAREEDDIDQARQWCQQASDLLDDAPDALVEVHREWVDRHATELDVTDTDDRLRE